MTAESLPEEMDEALTAPTTMRTGSPLSDHESEAIRHLARAVGGLTTAIRAVATGRKLHAPLTLEPLAWTEDGLSKYDHLARVSRERERRERKGRDIYQTSGEGGPMTRHAVSQLTLVAEAVSQALECFATQAEAGSADGLRYAIMADSHLAQFVRMIPEHEYTVAIREVWGREAMPVRLR